MKHESDLKLLTRTEVEEQFGISKRYLEIDHQNNQGPPYIRIGRIVRYRTCDLGDWIERCRVMPQN
jgi:predicted DNA-binding transcriptional regulator AlpA